MSEPMIVMAMGGFGLAALGVTAAAGLKGWQGWLDIKRLELAGDREAGRSPALERIEMAALKERIRKLESIAACVDL